MTKLLVQHWLTVIPLDSCRWMQNVRLMSIHQHVIYKMLSTLERLECRSNWYSLYCYNGTSVRTAKRTIIVYIF